MSVTARLSCTSRFGLLQQLSPSFLRSKPVRSSSARSIHTASNLCSSIRRPTATRIQSVCRQITATRVSGTYSTTTNSTIGKTSPATADLASATSPTYCPESNLSKSVNGSSKMSSASKSQQASNASLKAASRILAVPPSPTVHPRFSQGWWKDWSVVFIVFAITGSTTVRVVKPLLSKLFGIEGTFLEGPWAYRLAYLATTLPLYSMVLIAVGTVFGRGPYFRAVAARMWGRFLPKTKAIKV